MAFVVAASVSGCGSEEPSGEASTRAGSGVAQGSEVAACEDSMPVTVRAGDEPGRKFVQAGRFGLLQDADGFAKTQAAGQVLDPAFDELLIAMVPATVVSGGPVTLSVPAADRDDVGLLYGSLRGYGQPLASVTFEPCPGRGGTSWPGGIALSDRDPVTLLVKSAGSNRLWNLRVGA